MCQCNEECELDTFPPRISSAQPKLTRTSLASFVETQPLLIWRTCSCHSSAGRMSLISSVRSRFDSSRMNDVHWPFLITPNNGPADYHLDSSPPRTLMMIVASPPVARLGFASHFWSRSCTYYFASCDTARPRHQAAQTPARFLFIHLSSIFIL